MSPNAEVIRIFNQIADLMEINGDDSFRVTSYRRVARTIDDLNEDVAQVATRGALIELPGVGKASAAKIQEFLDTGTIQLRDELCQQVPEKLLELLRIPGLGPKKISLLWKAKGIDCLDALKAAIATGALADLKGFAERSIEKIREGIEFLSRDSGRTRLGVAWEVAEIHRQAVAALPGVKRVEHAGSLRRGCETVGDLDLLCIADKPREAMDAFVKLPGVVEVLGNGETKSSVRVEYRPDRRIQVDLRAVPEESFGAAWQYFTGSKAHNVRLRELAGKRGWTLNEYSLSEIDGGKVVASRSEADIYAALGLVMPPPELREHRGEFDLTAPPELLELSDIRGELHMHTTASDGRQSVEEMIAGAKARGYDYICITDHSPSSVIANGLKPERLRLHMAMIREAARKTRGLEVWIGAEVDILPNGKLDYDDEILAQLDFVVASIHAGMSDDIVANTKRALAAIANPHVNLLAHPTGRMLGRRDAMPLDIPALAKEAAATGTALEINASTYRLDLKDQHARAAREAGALLCINCDAHAAEQFDQLRFGVMTARRAGATKADVLNTRSAADICQFVKKKRP